MKHYVTSFYLLFVLLFSFEASGQKSFILSPYTTKVKDASIGSINPDHNYGTNQTFGPYSWTQGGAINDVRGLIRFDFKPIPTQAKILEALLVLYFDPFSVSGLTEHSGDNPFYIQRITEPWEELSVTWYNQPSTTDENQVTVPASVYGFQNYVVDVTEMVKDMRSDSIAGNQGFMLKFLNEQPYKVVLLCSKESADPSRHIQLWVTYDDEPMTGVHDIYNKSTPTFRIDPNPATNYFTVTMDHPDGVKRRIEMYNANGEQVLTQNLTGSFSYVYTNTLPSGNYILNIYEGTKLLQTSKLEVTR